MTELSELLPLLLIVVVLFAIPALFPPPTKKMTLRDLGVCPPHRWRWEQIKDHEGVVHAERLICERCGPLQKQSPPERMDY
jgi:hypothetical protein